MPSVTDWQSSILLESLDRTPVIRMFEVMSKAKKNREKKIKKITRIFSYLFFRNACVTSSAI